MATRIESSEFKTVRGKFVAICDCISEPDVVKYAGELLQSNLISDAGHQAAIAVTGLPPANKVAHLVSEAANNVSNSPDNFYKFISILESRNVQLASTLRSDYVERRHSSGLPPQQDQPCAEFVTSLRQLYRTAQPPTWDPLPQCQHVKLAMIKEKGKRCGSDKMIAESRVKGSVDQALTRKVPVDSDRIFDAGTFDNDRQVILVEGVGGMGKTSLAYQYAQKWAEGKLSTFDAVVLVQLRDLNEHDVCVEVDCILPHLLFLVTGNCISKEMARLIVDKQKILLILDGWDESPTSSIRKLSFLKDLLRSISPQTRILITSRPDFSLDLHGLANRIEILGFTKGDIHDYFENALKSHLPNSEVKSACDKLNSHFHCYPVIKSCCYVPLNAAIVAYIYLNRDQTLPVTRCELFEELVLCCIVRELETRQPDRVLEDFSSFEDLPADLKEQLHNLSELAFKGVKIAFTQKELTSFSTLGLVHSVQGFGSIGRKLVTCNFIHLAVQELLAAYYISRLEPAEHSEQFETILNVNLKFPVLQFYAGLTGLTNESVRNLITGFHFDPLKTKSQRCFLAFLNCIFEAQIHNQSFFEQMVHAQNLKMIWLCMSLTPMYCLSVQYFLSSIRTVARGQIHLNICNCSIDDQCLGMLLGISSEHSETSSPSDVLESIENLQVHGNEYTDTGIGYIARALISNSTLKTLHVGSDRVTDMGMVPLLEVLPRQQSLEKLVLDCSLSHPDESLKKMGECVGRSTLKRLQLNSYSPSLQSEEAVKEWVQSVGGGGNNLIRSLECSQVTWLVIYIHFPNISCQIDKNKIQAQLRLSLQETVTSVDLEREKKSVPALDFHIRCLKY